MKCTRHAFHTTVGCERNLDHKNMQKKIALGVYTVYSGINLLAMMT